VPGGFLTGMKHYLGICLVLCTVVALALLALHACTSAVNQTVSHVADAFSEVLSVRPQIKIDQRVILTQTAPIAEFAVVTKEELVSVALSEHLEVLHVQVPLTEKSQSASATFRIKAGFDLRQPFSVSIDPATRQVRARMPHAKILSVEQLGDVTYHGEGATLNRISNDETAEIMTNLNSAAHTAAENSGLKEDAERQVEQRLDELLQHNGQMLQIDWSESAEAK
jgi:hypothetical protein